MYALYLEKNATKHVKNTKKQNFVFTASLLFRVIIITEEKAVFSVLETDQCN